MLSGCQVFLVFAVRQMDEFLKAVFVLEDLLDWNVVLF